MDNISNFFSKQNPIKPQEVIEEVAFTKKSKENTRKHFFLVCADEEEDIVPIQTPNEIIINELKAYSSLRANISENSCPLNFYKLNEHRIPYMAKIAKMLFCVTASSVPSECLFSSAGQLVSEKRTRLQPECTEAILMLQQNKFE